MLLAALIVVELIWDPAYVRGLFGLILVPLAACTAACLMAAAQAPALRLILLRSSATQWCLALGSVLIVSWLPVAVGAGLLSGAQGPSIAVVGMSVGVGLAGLNLWLATAFGPAPTIGVTVAGLTLSLIFGASALAARLWMLGPWAWAYSSITPDRMIFAVTVSLGCAAVTFVLWTRAVRRVARQ